MRIATEEDGHDDNDNDSDVDDGVDDGDTPQEEPAQVVEAPTSRRIRPMPSPRVSLLTITQ